MTDVLVEGGPLLHTAVELHASRDGLHWGVPLRLAEVNAPQEINYPSILSRVEEHPRPIPGVPWSGTDDLTNIDVLFILEHDAAHLGMPFTRDIDAVSVSLAPQRSSMDPTRS